MPKPKKRPPQGAEADLGPSVRVARGDVTVGYRADPARVAIDKADSQQGKDYLTGKAEWWEQRAKVAEEIIRKQERNA
jgi:uncharacterized protein YbjT (DUF2867 family)